MSEEYEVLSPITLRYGSNTRNPNPSKCKIIPAGSILVLDSVANDGNVWFIDECGERGKIECGSIENLLREGRRNGQVKRRPTMLVPDVGQADGAVCACKLPGFDANNPAVCPTCGKPHRH